MTDPTSTETIIKAMRILARDIQTDDGVVNQAIRQASERLEAQAKEIESLKRDKKVLVKTYNELFDSYQKELSK